MAASRAESPGGRMIFSKGSCLCSCSCVGWLREGHGPNRLCRKLLAFEVSLRPADVVLQLGSPLARVEPFSGAMGKATKRHVRGRCHKQTLQSCRCKGRRAASGGIRFRSGRGTAHVSDQGARGEASGFCWARELVLWCARSYHARNHQLGVLQVALRQGRFLYAPPRAVPHFSSL